jgi:hypothetical protein
MSFPKMGRVLPKASDSRAPAGALRQQYALVVAGALHDELGGGHRAIKTVVRWTGASERTAKNWLAGTSGPSGEHLIALTRNSDEVFDAILILAGRNSAAAVGAKTISELRVTLRRAVALADVISVATE